MNTRIRTSIFAIAASCAALCATPAAAGLHLCNQTSYVLYAATGIALPTETVTRGWARVAPGACAEVVPKTLGVASYYVYAHSAQAHAGAPRAWGGQAMLCARDTNFTLHVPAGALGCRTADAFPVPFSAVDTQGKTAWSTTFTESKAITTMTAARAAGITRLLNDVGYKVGDGRDAKRRDDALARFRARMKLPLTATADDLIDALETEALKAAAPAGYSICNDTEKAVYAALGQRVKNVWVAKGWWQVGPGGCAKVLTTPLSVDKVYLLVERHGNKPLVTGKAKFCVADIEFEIQGREHCSDRGLREAGFAETDTKGRSGFSAHVSDDGLIPAAPTLR